MSKGPYTDEQIREIAESYDPSRIEDRALEAPEVQPIGYYLVEKRPSGFQQWVAKVFVGMIWKDYQD